MAIFVGSEIALGQWAEMYAVRVAMLPLGIHFEYIDRTDGRSDGQTPDRCYSLLILKTAVYP